MQPRTLLRIITTTQNILLAISITILVVLPPYIAFSGDMFPQTLRNTLFALSHISVALVMSIRPLANFFPRVRLLAQLVILRKGFGVLSASIIIAFFLARIITNGTDVFAQMLTVPYWSMDRYTLLAHLGDITALILLITSNNLSKRLLGRWWKRVQKTAYIYFYAGAFYAYLTFNDAIALTAIIIVTFLTVGAFLKKVIKTLENQTI